MNDPGAPPVLITLSNVEATTMFIANISPTRQVWAKLFLFTTLWLAEPVSHDNLAYLAYNGAEPAAFSTTTKQLLRLRLGCRFVFCWLLQTALNRFRFVLKFDFNGYKGAGSKYGLTLSLLKCKYENIQSYLIKLDKLNRMIAACWLDLIMRDF